LTALSTIVRLGSIGWPPTMTSAVAAVGMAAGRIWASAAIALPVPA
jgi:hypothetical protein